MAQRGRGKQNLSLSFLKETPSTCMAELYEKAAEDNGKVNKTWAPPSITRVRRRWEITNLL